MSAAPDNLPDNRAALRLRSLGWALAAGLSSGSIALAWGGQLEPALRAGGCGLFYGLLAFHLQRVDPNDDHLQAGLVGAVCAISSLAAPLEVTGSLSEVMMAAWRGWLPLWLPLVGSALLLRVVSSLKRP